MLCSGSAKMDKILRVSLIIKSFLDGSSGGGQKHCIRGTKKVKVRLRMACNNV